MTLMSIYLKKASIFLSSPCLIVMLFSSIFCSFTQIAVVIQKNMSEIGASIAEVSQHLKGVPEKAIRDAVEFLSAEGHIYSTIDDDHFKATDG